MRARSGCRWYRSGGCCARSGCLRAPRSFRATQQDPERVRPWCEQGYPVIRAEVPQAGATIYLGDDVASTGVRHAVNIISAIVPKGKLQPKPLPALEAVKPSDSTDEMWIERRAQPDRESRVRNADDLRRRPENALCRLRRSRLELLSVAGWSVGGPNREGLSAAEVYRRIAKTRRGEMVAGPNQVGGRSAEHCAIDRARRRAADPSGCLLRAGPRARCSSH